MLASTDAGVLAFDDFDKVKVTERVGEFIFSVFDSRIRNGRPIILATNLTGEQLLRQFKSEEGPALMRRIKEYGRIFAP